MKKVADLLLINKKCKIVIKLKEAGEIKLNEEKNLKDFIEVKKLMILKVQG